MITATALAVTLVVALVPAAPTGQALGPRLFRNYSTGMCLTYGTDPATEQTIAVTGNCDPYSKRTLWKRTAGSKLASGSMCLSRPTTPTPGQMVRVRRCATGAKTQRLSFTKLKAAIEGDHVAVRWKGAAPGFCLASNFKGQVYPNDCRNADESLTWVIVRWSTD